MQVALTIAGSDSSGGAGIQADLKTFQALGVFGMSAITAVTVQNTQKVYDVQEMPPKIVYDQILCLFDDIDIHAVKIGMVSSIALIESIARALKAVDPPAVVLDPVMISKSGYRLLNQDAQDALVEHLFPLSEIVTQPALIVAIMVAMIGYAVMSLLMTATPLAMTTNGFKISDATFVCGHHQRRRQRRTGLETTDSNPGPRLLRYIVVFKNAGRLRLYRADRTTGLWHRWRCVREPEALDECMAATLQTVVADRNNKSRQVSLRMPPWVSLITRSSIAKRRIQ